MIPQIPTVKSLDELTKLVNDRLRRAGAEISQRYRRGEDLDLDGFRIRNSGDPVDGGDAMTRAAADRRYSTPRTVTERTTAIAAGTAGSAICTFSPALYEYGSFSVESVAITGATGIGTFKGLTVVAVYVDEITAPADWVSIDGASGVTDPLTIAVTPAGLVSHAAGDWVVFGDEGHYEISKLTAIAGMNYTLQRSWPGDAAPNAIFSSMRENHPAGTKLYVARTAKFTFAPAGADYDAGSDIITVPERLNCWLPNACVLAILMSAQFGDDTGPWTVFNTALSTAPGLRTLNGGNYSWVLGGTLTVNQVTTPKRVQFESSIRVSFGRAGTAPTGASLTAALERSTNNGGAWTTIDTVTIAAGNSDSFTFGADAPGARREPYGTPAWPYPVLHPDDLIRWKVTGVGSTVAGANLALEVCT